MQHPPPVGMWAIVSYAIGLGSLSRRVRECVPATALDSEPSNAAALRLVGRSCIGSTVFKLAASKHALDDVILTYYLVVQQLDVSKSVNTKARSKTPRTTRDCRLTHLVQQDLKPVFA